MWRFWIDTGGTFTDCLAEAPDGSVRRAKVLSSSCVRGRIVSRVSDGRVTLELAESVPDGFFVGYRLRVLGAVEWEGVVTEWRTEGSVAVLDGEIATQGRFPREAVTGALCELASPEEPPVLVARILTGCRLDEELPPMEMRLATTRGTNALLERNGAKVAFFVTKGFGDLLKIGNQQRPDLFELGIQKPDPLAELVFEVDERLDATGAQLRGLDESAVRAQVAAALEEGAQAFGVAFLHSYRNSEHERRFAKIAREMGVRYVSLSSELSPFAKLLPRAETAVVDAYLSPILDTYLDAVEKATGGEIGSREKGIAAQGRFPRSGHLLRVMTSAGGLVGRGNYRSKDSLLSGPAGGVVGAANVAKAAGFSRTIAFDMGGTSTDVSRYDEELDYQFEQRIGAARVFAPSLRIETVAAGGGSICWFDGSALRVGPESAGADPGPACYGAGGPLALTDVNLLLGRLDASRFGIPVFPEASRSRLVELKDSVESTTGRAVEVDELLHGFLAIANERMAEAIRKISVGAGFDPAEYALVAFGGAGGLHACAVADILNMDTVLFPADAGLLSAYGLSQARLEQFAERQVLRNLSDCASELSDWVAELENEASRRLAADGVEAESIELGAPRHELRYRGQESILVVEGGEATSLKRRFEEAYEEQFGFLPEGLDVELVALRVAARSREGEREVEIFEEDRVARPLGSCGYVACGSVPTSGRRFVDRQSLEAGESLEGPTVVQDAYSTVFVDTGWSVIVGSRGSLQLRKQAESKMERRLGEVVELELFTNRFLSLVDEMGALLERTAFSTNVKDRKDFSCALLDANGYLVANAPHIPVHLGALGVCVREVLKSVTMGPGDVVATNHPAFGGSHLPDVTLIAPVYSQSGDALLGYVANRAHHAELGGISPGSMPPNAKNLLEEGVVIAPMKLVEGGKARWDRMVELLAGGRYPSRSVKENVADLSAQLASARRGQKALRELAEKEGAARVALFMGMLKERAAKALRDALERRAGELGQATASEYVERLDSGAAVCARVERGAAGRWVIDFAGSEAQQASNYNATPAIVTSAVIYALRLLADQPIPLNEGFLDVVEIRIPEGMLSPRFEVDPVKCPAVVAGNVEVSQLIVSTLLKAFGLAACSQSTMNNLIFGTERFGYYETIGGGEGATAEREGASGIHTHMTNTAMTDPEIMELRYPVRVERFGLRKGSGGVGAKRGGDGIVKRIRFLEAVTLSLLTQRRMEAPFGMEGGGAGACGEQFLIRADGVETPLAGNGSWEIEAGEAVEIRTPGGGAWGVG